MKKKLLPEIGSTVFFPTREFGTTKWYAVSGDLIALGPVRSPVWVDHQRKIEFPLTENVFTDFDTAEAFAKTMGK